MVLRKLPSIFYHSLLLTVCGAVSVFSFSPLEIPGFIYFSLGVLFFFWHRTSSAWHAAVAGFAFGLGYFLSNVYWIFLSMHRFGSMPAWMAACCVLAFSAYLAMFPAVAGFLAKCVPWPRKIRYLLFPIFFVLTEWLRGSLFTGFPWANIGTSQLVLLRGWFPIIGVYGVGWLMASIVAITLQSWKKGLFVGLGILLAGSALSLFQWTTLLGTVRVSLVQGGVPQNMRWNPAYLQKTRQRYIDLVSQTKGQLVILPEAAIPELLADTPQIDIKRLMERVELRGATLLSGYITGNQGVYFNSVVHLGEKHHQVFYSKHHLLPFGEYVPLPWFFGWMYHHLDMPMSGFEPGPEIQLPIQIGASKIGADVCYEDIFGHEIRINARAATLLVNISNMAWFDGSWAAEQHLEMARVRALENNRWMLTSTNTGVTAIINPYGQVVGRLAKYAPGVLEGTAENRTGNTLYMHWGDTFILILLLGKLGWGIFLARAKSKRKRQIPTLD